jgi:hypothetical protein
MCVPVNSEISNCGLHRARRTRARPTRCPDLKATPARPPFAARAR